MSIELREEILGHAAQGTLLYAMFHDYGGPKNDADDATVLALAELHNVGEIDVLAIVTPEAIEPFAGHKFWHGNLLYRALIVHLDASAEELLRVIQTLIEAAGQDLMAGLPVEEFAKWCALDPARPAELLNLVDRKVPNADRFLAIAIMKGVAVDHGYFMDRGYAFLEMGSEIETQSALNALSRVPLPDADDWDRQLAAFSTLLARGLSDAVRSTLLRAVALRLKDAPAERYALLTQLGIDAMAPLGDLTIDAAAHVLVDAEELTSGIVDGVLSALLAIKTANKGTIEILDVALAQLVKRGESARARSYIEQLLRRRDDPVELEQLDSLCYALHEVGGQVREDWVVAWLLDGDYDLCGELDHALFGAGNDEEAFTVDFSRYKLSAGDYIYLARKTIGTFFLKQRVAASLLVSLLRTAPPETVDEIVELLIDPMLQNYAGIAEDYLKAIAEDEADPVQGLIARALASQETYLDGFRAMSAVPELSPSERERRLEWQRQADTMAKSWRAARKKSIFASIVTESVILYGARAVSWITDHIEEPRRIETPMGSISHSIEMPRFDVVDPIGLQQLLMQFRSEERPQ